MASLAKQVTKEQVLKALEHIIENDIKLIPSSIYVLEYEGRVFPPKEVIRWAAKLAEIPNWEKMSINGGDNVNEPLRQMGFLIKNKLSTDANLEIIKKYKEILTPYNEGEIYKWKLIKKFEGRPNLNKLDFQSEITSINYQNLIYHNGIAVRNQIAKEKADEYKECFEYLFDETIVLQDRIIGFQEKIGKLYASLGMTLHHHHDERTISTFLAFKYPNKYPLYKNSFYSAYCKKLGIMQALKNKRYLHYIDLINDFVVNYVEKDQELLNAKSTFLTTDCFEDSQNLIFAQDILYQALKTEDLSSETEEEILNNQFDAMKNVPLNQILYGPPGTGKTYNTINKAIEIVNPEFDLTQDRNIVKSEYERLVNEGQIVFTTFHQSMTYEDFIEGIKPIIDESENETKTVLYDIEDGILKKIVGQAKQLERVNRSDIDWDNADFYKMSLGGKNNPHEHEYCIVNNLAGISWGGDEDLTELLKISNWKSYRNSFNSKFPNNVAESKFHIQASFYLGKMKIGDIVVATKGNHIIDAIGKVTGGYTFDDENPTTLMHFRNVEWFAKDLNASPDRFLRKNISQQSIYQFYNSDMKIDAFKELTSSSETDQKNYVLIIDEINRGNVSQIFGELITLIEEDKRLGNDEAIEVTLPYSKEKFSVPRNLYIIGTMNTADRSVEALDSALRRRFIFEEMPPKYDLEGLQQNLYDFSASEILYTINKRIEKLLDRDHQIGHAYFLNKDETTIIDSFYKNIIPLLQEYFFGDYGKIGLVLGSGFVRKVASESVFAEFEPLGSEQFEEREIYEIIDHKNDSSAFENAIGLLMNKK